MVLISPNKLIFMRATGDTLEDTVVHFSPKQVLAHRLVIDRSKSERVRLRHIRHDDGRDWCFSTNSPSASDESGPLRPGSTRARPSCVPRPGALRQLIHRGAGEERRYGHLETLRLHHKGCRMRGASESEPSGTMASGITTSPLWPDEGGRACERASDSGDSAYLLQRPRKGALGRHDASTATIHTR